jgi:hypothetical protein
VTRWCTTVLQGDTNAEDVLLELWGSITITHPACGRMILDWDGGLEFGTGTLQMEQLVNVAGLDCN